MKNILKFTCLCSLLMLGAVSCKDFLDRPNEEDYNVDTFYQTDEQCFQAVNPLYSSPWYDVQRFFIQSGEVFSGNYYMSGDYLNFTVNSSDEDLGNCSSSLWAVNANANGVIENIDLKAGTNVSDETKKTVKGEALVWKAMAYFFLVRTFGEVPIVHSNSADIAAGNYNNKYKATKQNIYDYILLTLNKAVEWLPEQNKPGRIDRYSAYGLMSKVYLTKAGVTGTLSIEDLQNAAKYAQLVIDKSGRTLLPVYSDLFRIEHNINSEALISWAWKAGNDPWTMQNSLQSEWGMDGFTEFATDNWGEWRGPTVDLQDAFGESALSKTRLFGDVRRKATMMMYGDHYNYFWRDKGGFNWWEFVQDRVLNGVGANCVKHLVGNSFDHSDAGGGTMVRMGNGLFTHLLRLADVYLIYAEAKVLLGEVDVSALDAFNAVYLRARPSQTERIGSLTWRDVWKERRLELAGEGDRWYDYVRWSYYAPDAAIAEIKAQRRSIYEGLRDFYESGSTTPDPTVTFYDKNPAIPNVMKESFTMPFPSADVSMNPRLLQPPQNIDISQFTYK